MTDRPAGFAPGPEPAPLVVIPPQLRVGAGSASAVPVTVTNTASEPRELLVLAVGVDQAWLPGPVRTSVLAPGESADVAIRIAPTAGTLPAEYPLAVTVQAVVPATGRASGSPAGLGETSIVVNPRAQLTLDATPEQSRFVRSQRIRLTVRNTGPTPATVDLEANATKGLLVRLGKRHVTVPPAGEARVRGRLVATRPRRIGGTLTHSWNVVASSPEIVRQVRGTAQQRALFGNGLMKAVAVLAVVAIWIAAVLVLVPQVTEKFGKDKEVSEASGGGAGDDGGDGSGDGGDGGGGGGAGGGGGKVKVTQAKSSATPAGVQVNGTVAADKPEGVTVTLKGISLVDEEAQTAENFDEVAAAAQLTSSGKASPAAFLLQLPQERAAKKRKPTCSATSQCTAVTTDDGTWSIPDVAAPGFYLVTFSKPGYESQRFVIDAATFDPTEPLEVEMVPGAGELSGMVRGPGGGALGGATVTVSDGTSTITTSTASRGKVGRWVVSGLETPASYLVEVSSYGLGTESRLAELGPSGKATADMRLKAGIAVLRGEIKGKLSNGNVEGLGGVTVSVSDSEGNVRSAATVTTGNQTGTFRVPGLPAPGDYTVTITAPGYQTETRNLSLEEGEGDKRLDESLVSAFGVVSGVVRETDGDPKVGAGLTLSDGTHTYKNTSVSRTEATRGEQQGGFQFTGVTPGIYQLTTEYFGFLSSVLTVEVTAGQITPAQPRLAAVDGGVIPRESTITGSVVEAGTGDLVDCQPVTSECLTATVSDSEGTVISSTTFERSAEYTLPDLGSNGVLDPNEGLVPGLYRVTVSAPHYEVTSIRVQVGLRDTARADTIQLAPAPVITGNITAAAGRPGVETPDNPNLGRTCVWAVPGDATAASVGSCQDAVDAGCTAIEVSFTPTTTGPQCASVDGVGRYLIEVPRRGQYTVIVKPADTEYVQPDVVRLNAPAGSTLLHNVQLNRYGRVTLTALVAGSGGALQAASGATLSLTQGSTSFPTDPAGATSTAEGLVFFKRLLPGTYTVNGTNGTRAADPFNVVVGYNQEVERIVPLIRRVSQLIGRVTTNIGGATSVDQATVQVIGPVGYSGTQPFNGSVTARTASDGCFVVTRASSSPAGVGDCTGTYPTGVNQPWQRLDLLSNTVSEVRISKTGYDTLILRNVDLDEADVNQFTLEPSPVTFLGNTSTTRITAVGTTPNFANVTFAVDSTTTSAGTITVKAASSGDLTWTDTRYPTLNKIRPGSYTITASLPGYTGDQVAVTCPVATTTFATCSPERSLVLRQLGSLRVNAVDASSNPVNDVVATLIKGGATVDQRSSANDGNNATFPGLLPGATDYALRVQAAGFDFDATALSCTPEGGTASSALTIEAGKLTTCDVTLTRLGTFTGTLNGVLADAPATDPFRELAGATVQATPCTAPATPTTTCTAVDASRRLTATTNAAGQYSLSGTNRIEGIGQGWWLLTTVLPGWSQAAASSGALPGTLVNVTTGGNLPQNLTMYVNRVNFTARVNDQGGTRVDDATVKLLQGATEVATGTLTGTGTSAQYDFTNVLPGPYTLEMTGGGLVRTTVQVEIAVGVANQSFQAFVSRASNSVTGVVRGSDRPGGLNNVDVKMYKCAASGSSCDSTVAKGTDGADLDTDTNSSGSWQLRTVPNGRFLIKFTKTGYGPIDSAIITFDHTQAAPTVTTDMSVTLRTLNVTIDPSTNSDDLTGATLTLTPAGTTENTAPTPATVATRSATFGQIRFGCWNIAMTLPTDHYGTITYPATTTNTAMSCSGNVIVPPTASASSLTVTIDLEETELRVSVTATALAGAGSSHPAPTTADVDVTGGPASAPFSRTLTALPTSGFKSLWVKPGSYSSTASAPAGFSSEFWPDKTDTATLTRTNGPQTLSMALAERRGSVDVSVTGATATRWVRITVAAGSGQTAPVPAAYATGVQVTSSAAETFTLPSGNWTFTATFVTANNSTTQLTGSTPASATRNIDEFVETGNVTLAPTYPPPPGP